MQPGTPFETERQNKYVLTGMTLDSTGNGQKEILTGGVGIREFPRYGGTMSKYKEQKMTEWKEVQKLPATGTTRKILAEQDARRKFQEVNEIVRFEEISDEAKARRKALEDKARKEGLGTGSLKGPQK